MHYTIFTEIGCNQIHSSYLHFPVTFDVIIAELLTLQPPGIAEYKLKQVEILSHTQ